MPRIWNGCGGVAWGGGRRQDAVADLADYVKKASPGELLGANFGSKLDALIDELRLRREATERQQPSQSSGPLTEAARVGSRPWA
ncbi:MAG: hypothetical protein HC890_03850 [Chloroflexaceae bacterium]|nr:hypothetical protein [Chloroflexaceae bacterium]